MYRDEHEALKTRRDALAREVAEIDECLKAIKKLGRQKIVTTLKVIEAWKYVCAVLACALVLGSFAAMWCMILRGATSGTELSAKRDAGCDEAHGVIMPRKIWR